LSLENCPDVTDLRLLLLGELTAAEATLLERHVLECRRCIELAETLTADDGLVAAMRAQRPVLPPADRTVLGELMGRLEALSVAGSPSETPTVLDSERAGTAGGPGGKSSATPPNGPTPDLGEGPGRFAHYELLEELGRGGMGLVYKARDTVLRRVVALKMIHGGRLADPQEVARFEREARAAASLQHPNIVPVYYYGAHRGQHYLTMAYVAGGRLTHHAKRLQEDPRQVVALLEKIARAVQVAHEAGIIHRDLKPANVLLDEQGEPHVTDFGLAKFADASMELTQPGQQLGTPAYMAPEQAAGQVEQISGRSDVWALGVILYELLTGRRPFAGSGRNEVVQAVLNREPAPLRSVRAELGPGLETIVGKCLEKEPARRYATAAALADDLARWQQSRPLEAQPRTWSRQIGDRLRVGNRRLPSLALALLLACLAGTVVLTLQPSGSLGVDSAPPPRELVEIENQLAQKQTVELLGPTGHPRWYRWRTETRRPPPARYPDEPLKIESYTVGLMELLPDPQQAHYLFRAEVCHSEANDGFVGVFLLASTSGPDDAPKHAFCSLMFADVGDQEGMVGLYLNTFREPDLQRGLQRWRAQMYGKRRPPPGGGGLSWRKLAIEVAPDKLVASFEGEQLCIMPRLLQDGFARNMWSQQHPLPPVPAMPTFSPRGGLGLMVYRGRALFRNVAVEPLPDR
jgi:serine/threonine protein kinase